MKTMLTLLLMTVTALGDLNAWNNSTNAEISVAAITLGGVRNTSWPAQTNVAAGNPTATVATTAVNGSASTFMRSDASPAIPASFIRGNQTNVAAANPTATVATTAVNGTATTFMRSDASPAIPASFITGNQTNIAAANPSATISGSAINGSAATFMRSDAAPALSTVGTAGTYRSVTTDANGRVTAGTTPTTFSGYGISDTSANLAAALTDETGTGVAVFGTAPTFTTTALFPDGSVSTPGIAFNSETNNGFIRAAANTLSYAVVGVERIRFDASIIRLPSGGALGFANNGSVSSSLDAGIVRDAANIVRISKGSSATGSLKTGGFFTGVFTTATNYTAALTDHTILANGTTLTITLPTAVGITGQEYTIKLIANSTGTVATTSSQNIDGATTYNLSAQYKFVRVQSDGVQWYIVGSN